MSKENKFETNAIHVGNRPDPSTGAISPPIHLTSTYVQDGIGQNKGFDYSRGTNPTRERLEKNIAALEGGYDAIAFSRVSILDVTRRVAKETSNIIVKLFRSNCSIKLNAGDSKPFPAPTAPPIPKRRIVKKAPIPEKILACLIAFEFSAEKVLCQ